MKILLVSHSSVLKSHRQKLVILSKTYGHDITLAAPPYWYEGGVKVLFTKDDGLLKYAEGRGFFRAKNSFVYTNAAQIIKQADPDLVHIEEEPFDPMCLQFAREAKKAAKKSIFFTWENINKKHSLLYALCEKYAFRHAAGAIAGSVEAKRVLEQKGYWGRTEVIPQYGVDLCDYAHKKPEPPKTECRIVYAGRLTPEKGLETLIEAASGINSVKLYVVGSGDKKYSGYLKEKAYAMMGARCYFIGHISKEDMPDFLSTMHILVLPSKTEKKWKEQFGRVLTEAFAAKIFVIGSGSGEIPNVIGNAGLVFEEKNVFDLADKIIEAMSDEEKYINIVNAGYERVKKYFTNDAIAAQIDRFYNEIAK